MCNNRVHTQRDIELLLAEIPLRTPADESKVADILQMFISLRNAAFEGAGVPIPPGLGLAFSIPELINKLKEGNYADAAVTLISITGETAGAFSFLVTAGIDAGAFASTSALASAGVVTGLIAEAAGPFALAAGVLVATFRIPINTSENIAKLFYITDTSGILTSWMFNMPEISPHSRLTQQARTAGYCGTDISEHCRAAHRRVDTLWRRQYQGNPAARQTAMQAANNNWEQYWLRLAGTLEQRLAPVPSGVGMSMVRRVINETRRRNRRAAAETEAQHQQHLRRRRQGGYWFRTEDGIELFMPDSLSNPEH